MNFPFPLTNTHRGSLTTPAGGGYTLTIKQDRKKLKLIEIHTPMCIRRSEQSGSEIAKKLFSMSDYNEKNVKLSKMLLVPTQGVFSINHKLMKRHFPKITFVSEVVLVIQ